MSLRWRFLLGVTATMLLSTSTKADDLTDAIPGDAKVVVILSDAKDLESRIKDFTQEIGFPIPPEVDLQSLLTTFGVPDVWNPEEGLAIVVREAAASGVAFLVPTSDSDKALEALNAEETDEEGLFATTVGDMNLFLVQSDDVLVLATDAAGLEGYDDFEESLEDVLSDEQKGVREDMDVFFYVDVAAWRPLALEGLLQAEAAMQQIQDFPQAEEGGLMTPAMLGEMMKGYVSGIKTLIEETDALYGGLYLTEAAIHMEIDADFADGSKLAAALKPGKAPSSTMLQDLPDLPFYAVVATEMEPFREILSEIVAAFVKIMATELKDAQSLADSMEYLKWVKSYAALSGSSEKGSISIGRFVTEDPQALVKDLVEAALQSNDFNRLILPAVEKPTHTTKTIEGLKVEELTYDFSKLMEDELLASSLQWSVGPSGKLRAQIAVIDGDVIYAQGDSEGPDPITYFLEKKPLADQPRVQAILKEVPKEASALALLDVFGLFEMIKQFADQGGFPNPLQLEAPEELPPPIAFSLVVEEGGVSADIAVPAALIQTLIRMGVEQMQEVQQIQP